MGYSVPRMPALPIRDWVIHTRSAHGAGGDTDDAWQRRADSARNYFLRPMVAEAIYIASPGFHDRLLNWDWRLRGSDDRKMLTSFERYLNRMCFRCTPFGMFSTVSYAPLQAEPGQWLLDSAAAQAPIERAARIDGEALGILCEKLNRVPDRETLYAVNASLYSIGDSYRFNDWKPGPGTDRIYDLAAIDGHPLIDALIRSMQGRAVGIATLENLLAERAQAEDIDLGALIEDLIKAKVLVPTISLDPLNANPTRALAATLAAHPTHAAVGERLRELDAQLRALAPATPVEQYIQLDREIRDLTGAKPKGVAIQVDAFRKHDNLAIDAARVEAAVAAIDYLSERFSFRYNSLDAFCDSFNRRYGRGAVPLMEALDNEAGIGYEAGVLPNKLLDKLGIRRRTDKRNPVTPSEFDELLLRLIQRDPMLLSSREIRLAREDVDQLPLARSGTDGPGMHAILHFPMMRQTDGARARTTVLGGLGVSGAVHWVSRFCHGDQRLHEASREYARQVEAESPAEVIHAEITYLPNGRMANVLTRAPIWTYRINLVDPPIEPGAFDLSLSDLVLTVNGKEVCLWSRRLAKRVIPHLTSAHNAKQPRNLTVYKFLAALQTQGLRIPKLDWGTMFQAFEYRPRLRFEDLVLAPARWHIRGRTLAKLGRLPAAGQGPALRAILAERRAPRRIELEERDNTLVLDLDDALDFEQLLRLAKKGRELVFSEVLEDFDEEGLVDGELAWRHEVIVPLRRPAVAAARTAPPPQFQRDQVKVPAAQALFVKLYGGHETLDTQMLPLALDWLARQRAAGNVERWFFIRYGDPDWHLRLRVFPPPGRHGQALVQLMQLAEQAQQAGIASRYEFSAYEREMVRYGGPRLIGHHEDLFCIDSDLVAAMLHGEVFSAAQPARWAVALVAIDALLADFGLAVPQRLSLMAGLAASFKEEFRLSKQQTIALGDEYRKHARDVLAALRRSDQAPAWSRELYTLLDGVSARRRAVAAQIMRASPPTSHELSMVSSQVHMLCNRLFHAQNREYEVLVYDYLARAYRSLDAVMKQDGGSGQA